MWTYNYNNELYHYGIKGMKWGVRKSKPSTVRSYRKKFNKATEKIKNSKPVKEVKANYEHGKRYGALGVAGNAWGQTIRANNKYIVKGLGVALLNTSVNNFIKNSNASYGVKRGADFVRKAGITALSISAIKDSIQMYANIGASALGAIDRYSNSNNKR